MIHFPGQESYKFVLHLEVDNFSEWKIDFEEYSRPHIVHNLIWRFSISRTRKSVPSEQTELSIYLEVSVGNCFKFISTQFQFKFSSLNQRRKKH